MKESSVKVTDRERDREGEGDRLEGRDRQTEGERKRIEQIRNIVI